ncbi:hypothetical protein FRB99_008981 [Tulasnella sp. 403]|nr:hypothetical protein FRB99_008981 [Tulasnella sp. 403]
MSSQLSVPQIDDATRRSMEHEERPLPDGWVRQFDPVSQHHFYVDTKANPPRSIWDHPLEDPTYLKSQGKSLSDDDSDDDLDDLPPAYDEKSHPPPPGPPDNSAPLDNSAPSSSRAPPTSPKSRGLIGKLMSFLDDSPAKAERDAAMQQRYLGRRQVFGQNQVIPPTMLGPMYPQNVAVYTPPPTPFSHRSMVRAERRAIRAEKRVYRDERRALRDAERDARRAARWGLTEPMYANQAPIGGGVYANRKLNTPKPHLSPENRDPSPVVPELDNGIIWGADQDNAWEWEAAGDESIASDDPRREDKIKWRVEHGHTQSVHYRVNKWISSIKQEGPYQSPTQIEAVSPKPEDAFGGMPLEEYPERYSPVSNKRRSFKFRRERMCSAMHEDFEASSHTVSDNLQAWLDSLIKEKQYQNIQKNKALEFFEMSMRDKVARISSIIHELRNL